MKKLITATFIVISLISTSIFSQSNITVIRETSIIDNPTYSGVETDKTKLIFPGLLVTYDFKKNINGKVKDDVFSIFGTNLVKTDKFLFEPGLIKTGDMKESDKVYVDLYFKGFFKNFTVSFDFGQGASQTSSPCTYVFSRVTSEYFTGEGGFLSKDGYSSLEELTDSKFYWGALHNKHFFVAGGNQVKTTWWLFGTKGFEDFGSFGFISYDRSTGNIWFRNQIGVEKANQNFFSQDNYVFSSSYLISTAFHFTHFSSTPTKGLYALKVDFKRTGNIEKKELLVARQFGWIGQLGIGFQNQLSRGNGVTAEYFNSVKVGKFTGSIELRYESLDKILNSYFSMGYSL